jgi:dihydrofolate reductase
MTLKCDVFIATSLDGFIARYDGQIDWLDEFNRLVPQDEDCGYLMFFTQHDCLILGRNTFEKVMSFPQWPYGEKPVFVMSKRGSPSPHSVPASVTFSAENPIQLLEHLERIGLRNAYVDGGELIQSFLKLNLIDTLTITRIPILIGEGKRLFGHLEKDIKLRLISSKSWPFGFVQDCYQILSTDT